MKTIISVATGLAMLVSPICAVSISLDYSHSLSSFFDTGTADGVTARAAVQAAADDISAAITTSLDSLSNYSYPGTSGSTTVTLTTSLTYTNPDTGGSETFSGSLSGDEFKIFVGARALTGSTLGTGGPGGVGVASSIGGFPAEGPAAAAIASADSSAGMTRSGHVISNLSGTFGSPFGSTSYSTDFGPTLGNLWFDNDAGALASWHLSHLTPVASGKNDLYSVALHEILHSLGIGAADAWTSQISGTSWTGTEVIAEHGTGAGLINGAGDHIASGIMSTRLSDGAAQEVVMDPDLTTGTRKELTDLDLAFLRDLGWETVPEPSSSLLLCLGGLFGLMARRR